MKQIHSPVHFVVRNDGNDGGDTDAVCEAVPEQRPTAKPPCLIKGKQIDDKQNNARRTSPALTLLSASVWTKRMQGVSQCQSVPWRPRVHMLRRFLTGCRLLIPRWCSPQCLPLSQTHLTHKKHLRSLRAITIWTCQWRGQGSTSKIFLVLSGKPPLPPILVKGYDPSVFPYDSNDKVFWVLRSIINIAGCDELFIIMFVYPGRLWPVLEQNSLLP